MLSIRKLRLFHQGLIVLVVPTLTMLALSIYLIFIVETAGKRSEQELNNAQVILSANDFCNALTDTEIASFRLLFSMSPEATAEVIEADRALSEKLEALKQSLASQVENKPFVANLESESNGLLDLQAYYSKGTRNPEIVDAVVKDPKLQYPEFWSFSALSKIFERSGTLQDIREEGVLPLRVRWKLLFAALITLLITPVLFIVLFWNLLGRIKHVLRNSSALACVELMDPPLKGGDDLARLDQILYLVAWDLKEMERSRAELFELVSGYLARHVRQIGDRIQQINENGSGLNQKGLDLLAKSTDSISRLSRLIDELSGRSRRSSGFAFSSVNMAALLEHASESVSQLAQKRNIKVQWDAQPSLTLVADKDKLVQVVLNLLSNAIKFSPDNSAVNLLAESSGPNLVLKVSDRGRGIPDDFKKRIFTRFSQAETADSARSKGTGLGLSICKSIVDEHGGTISVESELGKGSTFIVRLPFDGVTRGSADLLSGKSKSNKSGEAGAIQQNERALTFSSHPFAWISRCAPLWMKGLLLIMIPAVYQIALIVALMPSLEAADFDIKSLSGAYALACITTELDRNLYHYDQVGARLGLAYTKEEFASIGPLINSCAQLSEQLEQNSIAPERIEPLKQSIRGLLVSSRGSLQVRQKFSAQQAKNRARLTNQLEKLDSAIEKIRHRIVEIRSRDPVVLRYARTQLVSILGASLFFYCLLSVGLFWLIFESFTRRLGRMIDNSVRLKSGQSLVSPESGTDEIALLEQRFYMRANWLVELRELKDEVISVLSHELRTPLTGVKGMFFLLVQKVFGDANAACIGAATLAQAECAKIVSLVNDLLDIEKIQAGKLELVKSEVDANTILEESSAGYETLASARCVNLVCSQENSRELLVDVERITNALKAMVESAICRTPPHGTVLLKSAPGSGRFYFQVVDGGPLLTDVERKAAFEPFAADAGDDIESRLAFSLAKLVAEMHDGSIEFSEVNGRNALQLNLNVGAR